MELRYMGFDQVRNIREYKFDGVAENGTTLHFVVNADLAVFVMYHVGLQEGPALCLKKLCGDLEALQQLPHELRGLKKIIWTIDPRFMHAREVRLCNSTLDEPCDGGVESHRVARRTL